MMVSGVTMKVLTFFAMALALGAACTKSGSDESNVGGQAPQDLFTEAAGYAVDTIPCQTDADCCVVFDACHSDGYIVGKNDRATVAALLAQAQQTATDCLACMNPAIQVYCSAQHTCTGDKIDCMTDPFYSQAASDHCGNLTVPDYCYGGGGSGQGGGSAGMGGAGGNTGFQGEGGAQPRIIGCGAGL
jgi:hypothetical protein